MSDTYPSTTSTPTSEPPADAGPNCAESTGSAPSSDPVTAAIQGWMECRADLISQIPEINLYYDFGKAKRDWMMQEIERIDMRVAQTLALRVPNT